MKHECMNTAHRHGPLIAAVLVLAAGLLLLHVPSSHRDGAAIASAVLILVVLKHLGLLALVLGPLSVLFPGLAARFRGQAGAVNHAEPLDFGWSPSARHGRQLLGALLGAVALGLQLTLPHWWPAWLLLALLALNVLLGGMIGGIDMQRGRLITLPLMDPLSSRRITYSTSAAARGGRPSLWRGS
jgi:hypothetical protein